MAVYLSKDGKHASPSLTATYAAITRHTVRTENVGHKLYADSFFSSTALFDDLHTQTIKWCDC